VQEALYLDKHLYFMWLAVLLITTIGVLRSSITTMRGYRVSPVAASTAPVRTSQITCVQFGLFNYLSIHLFNNLLPRSGVEYKKLKTLGNTT